MIIYNVTVKTEPGLSEEWLRWMKEEHTREMMDTGLFIKYKICKLLEQDETEGITYIVQYYCNNIEQYKDYVQHYATELRQKSMNKFGNKTIAFRTLMELIN